MIVNPERNSSCMDRGWAFNLPKTDLLLILTEYVGWSSERESTLQLSYRCPLHDSTELTALDGEQRVAYERSSITCEAIEISPTTDDPRLPNGDVGALLTEIRSLPEQITQQAPLIDLLLELKPHGTNERNN